MLKGIYRNKPDFSGLDVTQLLQLLLLADRYEVCKVQEAAAAALQAVPAASWPWQAVLDILDLPQSCADQAACEAVVELAVDRLQQQLGDLDAVWTDEQLQRLLLALPFSALLQLLRSSKTRAGSENTVVYTILEWYKQQPAATRKVAQLKQLMEQVRMQHCGQLYVSTFMMQDELVLKCFSVRDLAIGLVCASEGQGLKEAGHQLLREHPSWTAPARPKSSMSYDMSWRLTLTELQESMAKHLAARSGSDDGLIDVDGRYHTVQGQQLYLRLCALTNGSDTYLSMYLVAVKGGGRLPKVQYRLHILGIDGKQSIVRPVSGHLVTTFGFAGGVSSWWGYKEFVKLGHATDLSDIASVLRAKGLVHADGCLHLKAEIKEIW